MSTCPVCGETRFDQADCPACGHPYPGGQDDASDDEDDEDDEGNEDDEADGEWGGGATGGS